MLPLYIVRVAIIGFGKPASNNEHLVPSHNVRAAASMNVHAISAVVGRIRLDPRIRRQREDIYIVIGERVTETVSTIQITATQSAFFRRLECRPPTYCMKSRHRPR